MSEKRIIKIQVDREVTDKDVALVQGLADGKTAKEIAETTDQNLRTVEAQLATLKKKYFVKSPVGLVILFYRNELIA